MLGSVFDMFMQVDRSNRRAQGGLGIGLTLVRSLVEMHGGTRRGAQRGPGTAASSSSRCRVLDGSGRRAQPCAAAARGASRRGASSSSTTTATPRTRSARCSTTLGATVAVAHSGQAALERSTAFAPDTVLLDIGMPEMDGYEVARRIRADDRHATMLSSRADRLGPGHDYARSRAAGFDHHLVKPPDIDELRAVLASGVPANREGKHPGTPPAASGRSVEGRRLAPSRHA